MPFLQTARDSNKTGEDARMEIQWRHCKQSSNRLQISKGVIGTAGEAGKSRTGTKK